MSDLKTLKDLKTNEVECKGGTFDEACEPIVIVDKLKQEAIKWVKTRREYKTKINELTFMEFHNITEEDLKDV